MAVVSCNGQGSLVFEVHIEEGDYEKAKVKLEKQGGIQGCKER